MNKPDENAQTPEENKEIIDIIPRDVSEEIPQDNVTETPVKPSYFTRVFGKESRFGRFLRLLLRWTIIVAGCIGVGFLIAFFVIYRPVKSNLQTTQSSLSAVETERDTVKAKLAETTTELTNLQGQYQDLLDSSEKQSTYIIFLELDNQITGMMYSLASNDIVAAKVMMTDAKKSMDEILPEIEKKDVDLASLVKDRLNVVSSEMEMKNAEDAMSDLQRLNESMNLVHRTLFEE